ISRQRGSGGAYIRRPIADRPNPRYIDRQMLREAPEYLRPHDPPGKIEPHPSWWGRPGDTLSLRAPQARHAPSSSDASYEGELFEIEKRIIQRIVEGQIAAEPTVIVGRGAAQMLRGRTCVLSVFLHAPEAWRIDRAKQVHSLTDTNAAAKMVRD